MTAGASAILVATGGGALAVAAFIDQEPGLVVDAAGQQVPRAVPAPPGLPSADARLGEQAEAPDAARSTSGQVRRSPTPEPGPTSASGATPATGGDVVVRPAARPARPTAAAAPVVTSRTVTETRKIPHQTRQVWDRHLARGDQRVVTPGVDGEETLRYRVTYVDGRQTDRRLLKKEVTRQPQHRIVRVGTGRGPEPGHGDDGNGKGDKDGNGDTDDGGQDGAGSHDGNDGDGGDDGWHDGDGSDDGSHDDDGWHDGDDGSHDDDGWHDGDDWHDGEGGGSDDSDCGPGFGASLPVGRSEECRSQAGALIVVGEFPAGVDAREV